MAEYEYGKTKIANQRLQSDDAIDRRLTDDQRLVTDSSECLQFE